MCFTLIIPLLTFTLFLVVHCYNSAEHLWNINFSLGCISKSEITISKGVNIIQAINKDCHIFIEIVQISILRSRLDYFF